MGILAEPKVSAHSLDFDESFRDHYSRLVRALTVMCGNADVAADCVQDAFVKAHLRWKKISQYEDPIGWVRRVAINRIKDEQRRSVRADRAHQRVGGHIEAQIDHLPVDHGRAATDALTQLPRQQRVALALFYVEQCTVAEVAKAMDLTEGAVKFHLHEGRKRLRLLVDGLEDLS